MESHIGGFSGRFILLSIKRLVDILGRRKVQAEGSARNTLEPEKFLGALRKPELDHQLHVAPLQAVLHLKSHVHQRSISCYYTTIT